MNVALPALVILGVFLPGIVYRRHATLAGPFRRTRSLADEALEAFVATTLIHAPMLAALARARPAGLRPDLHAVMVLIARPSDAAVMEQAMASVTDHVWSVGLYFVAVCLVARIAAWIVHSWAVSARTPAERLSQQFQDEPGARRWAEWEGLFGLADESPDEPDEAGRLKRFVAALLGLQPAVPREGVIALVAVVVELGREPYLYLGLLDDARFDDEGRLDRIELSSAYRRRLSEEATAADQRQQLPRQHRDDPLEGFYRITGRRLILRADEFRTMNIDYFGVEVVAGDDSSERPSEKSAGDSPGGESTALRLAA